MSESKRHVSEKLRQFLNDSRMGLSNDPILLFIKAADCFIGTEEVGGENAGPIVSEFQKTIGGKADRSPWCLSFIQSCIAFVEDKLQIESPLQATEHVLTLWNASPKVCRTDLPEAGDIILWRLENTISGHCGIIYEVQEDHYVTIEGNTSPSNKEIDRDGDGVYMKIRPKGGMGRLKEIGFLRPFISQYTNQKA